jgi:hypothetical protein
MFDSGQTHGDGGSPIYRTAAEIVSVRRRADQARGPASSPQGETPPGMTPPGMQPAPRGSNEKM